MSLIVVLSVVLLTLVGAFVSILGNLVSSFLETPAARHPRMISALFGVGLVALIVTTLLLQALNTQPTPVLFPTAISSNATEDPPAPPTTQLTAPPAPEATENPPAPPTESPPAPATEEPVATDVPPTNTPVPPTTTPEILVVTVTPIPIVAAVTATLPPPAPPAPHPSSGDLWRGGTSQDLPIELQISGQNVTLTSFEYKDVPYMTSQTCSGPKDGQFIGAVPADMPDDQFRLHTHDRIDGQERDIVLDGRFLPNGLIGGSLHVILEIQGCRHDMALQWWAQKQ